MCIRDSSMTNDKKEAKLRRENRIRETVELKAADRVPFVPQIGNFYALGYGLTIQNVMEDIRTLLPVMEKYVETYDPDMVYAPSFYPVSYTHLCGAISGVSEQA